VDNVQPTLKDLSPK